MNTYKIKIQEQISIWQDVYVTIEADDGLEAITKLKQNKYSDIQNGELYPETEDHIQYDYDNLEITDLGELKLWVN